MKKILLVSPYNCETGGIAKWTSHIVNHYNEYGKNEVDLTIFPLNRTTDASLLKDVFRRAFYGIKDYIGIVLKFKKTVDSGNYDVVQFSSSASISLIKDLLMLRILKDRGTKSIIHYHFGRIPELKKQNNWEWKLIKYCINLATAVVVIDKQSYLTLVDYGFTNVKLLPNPLSKEVNDFIIDNSGIGRNKRSILFVGHGHKTKGIYELVEACKTIPNITVKMDGTIATSIMNELKTIAENKDWLDICGNLPFTQVLADMMSCGVFVLPTYTEGFPNVIIESMACGCPIVTTDVGAIPEMLEDDDSGSYGIMVKPTQVSELKHAIEKMLDDDLFRNECQRNVVNRVNQRYSMPVVWGKLLDIWNAI